MQLTITFLVLALAADDPKPPPPPLFEVGIILQSGYAPLLTIADDGAWWSQGYGGTLAPEELARIAEGAQTMMLTLSQGPRCPTLPVTQIVRVPRGEVMFSLGCGAQPHPSVLALRNLADAFTVQSATAPLPSTILVRLDRWQPGQAARKEAIIVKRNGEWTTDNSVGTTGGEELERLTAAFDGAVLEVKPAVRKPSCEAEVHYDLELPGRGRLIWAAPCQSVSPSLSVALGKLFALAGTVPSPH